MDSGAARSYLVKQARLVIGRLERLTPDSLWARKASGCRGTLLRLVQQGCSDSSAKCGPDRGLTSKEARSLQQALVQGYRILNEAAKPHFR